MMQSSITILIAGAQINLKHALALLADIPEKSITRQPGGAVNHPAWTLAHLIHYHPSILSLVTGQAIVDPKMEPFAADYDAGSTPVDDPDRYPSKASLIQKFCDNHDQIESALRRMDVDLLHQPPMLQRWHEPFGTTSYALTYLLIFHEAEHLGQVAAWRRANGMSPAG